jgi:hypothetical protein
MPRLDPRQRLIREALLTGAAGCAVMAAAVWWVVRAPATPLVLADRTTTTTTAPSATPLPSASLWRPLSDTPAVTVAPAPPPPPTMRLISLSRRDNRWTALVDPGDGSGSQRVTGGEQIAGWQVDSVGQDTVELSSGGERMSVE